MMDDAEQAIPIDYVDRTARTGASDPLSVPGYDPGVPPPSPDAPPPAPQEPETPAP
jgi:hypothetical protein